MNKIESYIASIIPKNIPKSKQQKLRAEIEAHIFDRIDFYTEIGYDNEASINKALADMGEDEEVKFTIRNDFEELHYEHTWWALIASVFVLIIGILPLVILASFDDFWLSHYAPLSFFFLFFLVAEIIFCYKKGLRKCLLGIGFSNLLILPSVILLAYPFGAVQSFGEVLTYIIDVYTPFAVKDFLYGCAGYMYHFSFAVIVAVSVVAFVLSDKIKKHGLPKKQKSHKLIISTVLYLAVAIFVSSFYSMASNYFINNPERTCDYISSFTAAVEKDKDKYEEILMHFEGADLFFPSPDEVVINPNFNFRYNFEYMIFGGESMLVSEKLSKEDFNAKVKELNETCVFLTEPVLDDDGDDIILSKEKFRIFDYTFTVLDNDSFDDYISYNRGYPKEVRMIAISEKENKILYFAFYSQDLDYIDDMIEFVESSFPGWENV